MRIECEKCNAAFTIGDALLSDQPIGAQCPYCGHVRVVQKSDAMMGGGLGGPMGSLGAPSMGGPPRLSMPPLPGGPGGGLGGLPSFESGGGGMLPPMGGGDLPSWNAPSAQKDPFGGDPLGLPPMHQDGGLGGPPPGGPGGGGAPLAPSTTNCQVCGTALVDEFDKVIGLCEQHQRERGGQSEFPAGGAGSEDAREWRARTQDGQVIGPYTLTEIKNRIQRGELGNDDSYARGDGDFVPLEEVVELKEYAKGSFAIDAPKAAQDRRPAKKMEAPMRPVRSRVGLGGLALFVFALGVAGAGAWAWQKPDEAKRIYNEVVLSRPADVKVMPANPLKRLLATWRLAQPDVSGSPSEHLVTARARHLEDTWRGYQLAQDALKRALLLDEDNGVAIANFVENLIIWRDKLLTEEELRTAAAAMKFAQAQSPEDPAVFRALSAIDLARGDLAGGRTWAERAVEKNRSDAQAKLLLATSYLEGNVILAIDEAEQAAKLMPELRRADRLLARAYANAGRFASAVALLAQRSKNDPKNAAVERLRADLERELARFEPARRLYNDAINGEGDVLGARLGLAELLLELGDEAGAIDQYQKVLKSPDVPQVYKVAALGASARAELLRGRMPKAAELAAEALELNPRDAVSNLVRAEVALETGSASVAEAAARKALEVRQGEPAALVTLGRLAVKSNQNEKAVKHFEEAIQNDTRDPRLRALLASGFLAFGGTSQAFTVMRQAAELDPQERLSRHRKGLYGLTPIPIREAIDRFKKAAEDQRNRSVAWSAIALLHYQQGDSGSARAALDIAFQADDNNLAALILDAQMAIDRGATDRAFDAIRTVLEFDRGSAPAHLMFARAWMQQSKPDKAREEYVAALRSAPGLMSAEVELAGIEIKKGDNRDKAIEDLARAHRIYPHTLKTRQLLFEAGY